MTEHVCTICKERFEVTLGRARALTCVPCQERIDGALINAGYTKESAKTHRLAIIARAREEGLDAVLATIMKRGSTIPKVEKAIAGDVLTQYLQRVTAWREAENSARFEKQAIQEEADRQVAAVDKKVAAAKASLDSFTKVNADALKPILQAMAAPLLEQEQIERTRKQHAEEAAVAEASRAETRRMLVESR